MVLVQQVLRSCCVGAFECCYNTAMSDSERSIRPPSVVGDFSVLENLTAVEAETPQPPPLEPLSGHVTLPPPGVAITAVFMKYTSVTDPMQLLLILPVSVTSSSEGRWGEMLRYPQCRFFEHRGAVWQASIGSACVVEVEALL